MESVPFFKGEQRRQRRFVVHLRAEAPIRGLSRDLSARPEPHD
jgi:hypothetical protein